MKGKKGLLILALLLVAVLVGAGILYNNRPQDNGPAMAQPSAAETAEPEGTEPEETPEDKGVEAPDFTMADGEGNSLALSDFAGQPVVLNFWASWCHFCKTEMPAFDALAEEMADQVQFLMVNLTDGSRETIDKAAAYISEQGYTFPVYYDTMLEGAVAYSARSIPVTFFIDAEGFIQAYHKGALSEDMLREGLALIMPE